MPVQHHAEHRHAEEPGRNRQHPWPAQRQITQIPQMIHIKTRLFPETLEENRRVLSYSVFSWHSAVLRRTARVGGMTTFWGNRRSGWWAGVEARCCTRRTAVAAM